MTNYLLYCVQNITVTAAQIFRFYADTKKLCAEPDFLGSIF